MTYFSLCGCKLEILFLKARFEVLSAPSPPPTSHEPPLIPPPSVFTHTVKYKTEHDLAVIAVAFLVCSEESRFQSVRLASPKSKDLRKWTRKSAHAARALTYRYHDCSNNKEGITSL